MVMWALTNSLGGELFVPKIPSYRILDVANAISPTATKPVIGLRPGEKIHEEMITASDSFSCIDLKDFYAILPSDGSCHERYKKSKKPYLPVESGFAYNSGTNPDFLTIEQIRSLIIEHVDHKFSPIRIVFYLVTDYWHAEKFLLHKIFHLRSSIEILNSLHSS